MKTQALQSWVPRDIAQRCHSRGAVLSSAGLPVIPTSLLQQQPNLSTLLWQATAITQGLEKRFSTLQRNNLSN